MTKYEEAERKIRLKQLKSIVANSCEIVSVQKLVVQLREFTIDELPDLVRLIIECCPQEQTVVFKLDDKCSLNITRKRQHETILEIFHNNIGHARSILDPDSMSSVELNLRLVKWIETNWFKQKSNLK